MSKKNSFLQTYDWKDISIILLSLTGILLSLYLTINYYSGSDLSYCITGTDCDVVKKSAYSKIFGLPVSALGIIGYIAICVSMLSSLSKRNKWNMLFIFSSLGFSFSIYLTYLELFIIKAVCSYCIISALLITLILFLVINKKVIMAPKFSYAKVFILFIFMSAIVFAGSYSAQSPDPNSSENLAESNERQINLAKHISEYGAVMYGAYNCPHCISQKEMFGKAFKHIRYVECNNRGPNANPSLCFAKGIRSYPTWEIGGKFYQGQLTFKRLSEITNYNEQPKIQNQ